MGAREIALLTPSIAEVFATSATGEWCVTFEVIDNPNDWLQATRAELNFAYAAQSDPTPAIEKLAKDAGLDLRLLCWEGGKFVTLGFDASLGPEDVAKLADQVFLSFFRRPTYAVQAELIQLD